MSQPSTFLNCRRLSAAVCWTHRDPVSMCLVFPRPRRLTRPSAADASLQTSPCDSMPKSFAMDWNPSPSDAAPSVAYNSDSPLLKDSRVCVFPPAFREVISNHDVSSRRGFPGFLVTGPVSQGLEAECSHRLLPSELLHNTWHAFAISLQPPEIFPVSYRRCAHASGQLLDCEGDVWAVR